MTAHEWVDRKTSGKPRRNWNIISGVPPPSFGRGSEYRSSRKWRVEPLPRLTLASTRMRQTFRLPKRRPKWLPAYFAAKLPPTVVNYAFQLSDLSATRYDLNPHEPPGEIPKKSAGSWKIPWWARQAWYLACCSMGWANCWGNDFTPERCCKSPPAEPLPGGSCWWRSIAPVGISQ
jgi:hypothetical protein